MKGKSQATHKLGTNPAVQWAVGRARQTARDTAAKLPRPVEQRVVLKASDFSGIRTTDLLVDGYEARAARRVARALRLPRTLDDTSSWAALGAMAGLLRVVDDGRRKAVVVDAAGPRSVFTRWASKAGFAPVHIDVMRADLLGNCVEPGSIDMVARLHPHSSCHETVDEDLVKAASAVRKGGLIALTVPLGPVHTGGVGVAELRSLIARADEQGLSLVGDLDVEDGLRARDARDADEAASATPYGLAVLSFRRR